MPPDPVPVAEHPSIEQPVPSVPSAASETAGPSAAAEARPLYPQEEASGVEAAAPHQPVPSEPSVPSAPSATGAPGHPEVPTVPTESVELTLDVGAPPTDLADAGSCIGASRGADGGAKAAVTSQGWAVELPAQGIAMPLAPPPSEPPTDLASEAPTQAPLTELGAGPSTPVLQRVDSPGRASASPSAKRRRLLLRYGEDDEEAAQRMALDANVLLPSVPDDTPPAGAVADETPVVPACGDVTPLVPPWQPDDETPVAAPSQPTGEVTPLLVPRAEDVLQEVRS